MSLVIVCAIIGSVVLFGIYLFFLSLPMLRDGTVVAPYRLRKPRTAHQEKQSRWFTYRAQPCAPPKQQSMAAGTTQSSKPPTSIRERVCSPSPLKDEVALREPRPIKAYSAAFMPQDYPGKPAWQNAFPASPAPVYTGGAPMQQRFNHGSSTQYPLPVPQVKEQQRHLNIPAVLLPGHQTFYGSHVRHTPEPIQVHRNPSMSDNPLTSRSDDSGRPPSSASSSSSDSSFSSSSSNSSLPRTPPASSQGHGREFRHAFGSTTRNDHHDQIPSDHQTPGPSCPAFRPLTDFKMPPLSTPNLRRGYGDSGRPSGPAIFNTDKLNPTNPPIINNTCTPTPTSSRNDATTVRSDQECATPPSQYQKGNQAWHRPTPLQFGSTPATSCVPSSLASSSFGSASLTTPPPPYFLRSTSPPLEFAAQ